MDVEVPRHIVYALLLQHQSYNLRNMSLSARWDCHIINLRVVGGVCVVECWLCVILFGLGWDVASSPRVGNS